MLLNSEHLSKYSQGLQADLALETPNPGVLAVSGVSSVQAWPADLPAQVLAVAQVLSSAPSALTLPEIEAQFKGRGPWKNSLPRILATLEALDKVQCDGVAWRKN